jgi:hypothetical protein
MQRNAEGGSVNIPEKKRKAILDRWRAGVIAGYGPDTARFLERTLGPIVDWLIGAAGEDAMQHALEELMRVRSVQASSASQAVAFVFILRGTGLEILADDMVTVLLSAARSRIDELALRAFDCYADCRDRINTIRMHEVQAEKERIERVIRAMDGHGARTRE